MAINNELQIRQEPKPKPNREKMPSGDGQHKIDLRKGSYISLVDELTKSVPQTTNRSKNVNFVSERPSISLADSHNTEEKRITALKSVIGSYISLIEHFDKIQQGLHNTRSLSFLSEMEENFYKQFQEEYSKLNNYLSEGPAKNTDNKFSGFLFNTAKNALDYQHYLITNEFTVLTRIAYSLRKILSGVAKAFAIENKPWQNDVDNYGKRLEAYHNWKEQLDKANQDFAGYLKKYQPEQVSVYKSITGKNSFFKSLFIGFRPSQATVEYQSCKQANKITQDASTENISAKSNKKFTLGLRAP